MYVYSLLSVYLLSSLPTRITHPSFFFQCLNFLLAIHTYISRYLYLFLSFPFFFFLNFLNLPIDLRLCHRYLFLPILSSIFRASILLALCISFYLFIFYFSSSLPDYFRFCLFFVLLGCLSVSQLVCSLLIPVFSSEFSICNCLLLLHAISPLILRVLQKLGFIVVSGLLPMDTYS